LFEVVDVVSANGVFSIRGLEQFLSRDNHASLPS
jgi:hypothetical protein